MAHPGDALLRQPPEKPAGGVETGERLAVFPGGVVLGGGDLAAQAVGDQLTAVADAKNGDAQLENGRVHMGRALFVDAVGAAGEDETDGGEAADLLQGQIVGLDLAVNVAFAHPAGDQLVVLAAEIQDQDFLLVHTGPP